jgi:hypothetical protein
MSIAESRVSYADRLALWRLDPTSIYILNWKIERVSEAVLIDLGGGCEVHFDKAPLLSTYVCVIDWFSDRQADACSGKLVGFASRT